MRRNKIVASKKPQKQRNYKKNYKKNYQNDSKPIFKEFEPSIFDRVLDSIPKRQDPVIEDYKKPDPVIEDHKKSDPVAEEFAQYIKSFESLSIDQYKSIKAKCANCSPEFKEQIIKNECYMQQSINLFQQEKFEQNGSYMF